MQGREGPASARAGDPDELLGGAGVPAAQPVPRAEARYTCHEKQFRLEKRTYDNQYSQLYFYRLQKLAPLLLELCAARWPGTPVKKILDLPEGETVVVVGTTYKDMKLKPSILDSYNKDQGLGALAGGAKLVGAEDWVALEDESARVVLAAGPALPTAALVTGVVAAVRGSANPGGQFTVQDVATVGLGPQSGPAVPRSPSQAPGRYLALVSGLAVEGEGDERGRLSLLEDFLTGMLGGRGEVAQASQIVRLVVAGGLVQSASVDVSVGGPRGRGYRAALAPVRELDAWLAQVCSSLPVDVMAGAGDPTSQALPQQPLHPCLLPLATAYPTLNRVTNPHAFELEDRQVLGTSGQNVDDVWRYSDEEDRLAILERLLQWGHLLPTAPDTLTAYPFSHEDPFVLQRAPHIFFAGNQPAFASSLVEGPSGQRVRTVCLPSFSSSGVLVLVNLSTLDVHPLHFEAAL